MAKEKASKINGIPVYCSYDRPVDLVDLVEHPSNPNKHGDKQIALLSKIIRNQGWRNPVIVSKRSGFIVAGHGRLAAAKLLNVEAVPVDYQDFANEAEEHAHLIADNRIAELAEIDSNELAGLLRDLEGKIDLDLTGFDEVSLDDILTATEPESAEVDAEPQIDKAEELQAKWKTELGQVWELGDHRLLCGDSANVDGFKKLIGKSKADIVLTDPPYGILYQSNYRKQKFAKLDNDDDVFIDWIKPAAENTKSWFIFFCAWQKIDKWVNAGNQVGSLTNVLIWKKFAAMGDLKGQFAPTFEIALAYNRGGKLKEGIRKSAVFDCPIEAAINFQHPTQKPVKLITDILDGLPAGSVFDPFLGSGTTLIACENLKRKCYGVELNPGYVAVILQRWADATGREPKLCS